MNAVLPCRGAVALLLVALMTCAATAQESGNSFAGHELAVRWCASCHVVDAGIRRQGTDAVPSFAAISAMPSTTAASLAAFLSSSHGQMPDYTLSRADIANVSAYILSLRKQ